MRHSIGALATLSVFFTANSRPLSETSASRPTAKVAAARDKPMMVRYCRCHPYESLLHPSAPNLMTRGGVDQKARALEGERARDAHGVRIPHQVAEGKGEGAETEELRASLARQ